MVGAGSSTTPRRWSARRGRLGLDVDRFRIDLDSNATIEAFAADLDEVRSGGIELPSASFVSADSSRHGVAPGTTRRTPTARPRWRQGRRRGRPDRLPETLESWSGSGRTATREVEALTGRPRPVVEARLWSLAREWKLRRGGADGNAVGRLI